MTKTGWGNSFAPGEKKKEKKNRNKRPRAVKDF